MVDQDIFQLTVGGLLGLGVFMLKYLWNSVTSQKAENSALHARISNVELLVAKEYVERAEFREFSNRVIDKLETIDSKLDHKQDRPQ